MSTVGLTADERKYLQTRIKFAACASRIYALQKEIAKYDVKSLRKSAAIGADKQERMKLAALHRQYALEREKTANLLKALMGDFVLKKPGLVQHAGSGIRSVLSGLFGLGSSAVKGAVPGVRNAASGAATAVGKYAKKNPVAAMAGGTVAGLGVGSQLNNLQSAGSGVMSGIGDAAKSTGNYLANLGNIPSDIASGFGKAFGRFGGSGAGGSSSGSSMPSSRADYQERYKNYRLRPNRL